MDEWAGTEKGVTQSAFAAGRVPLICLSGRKARASWWRGMLRVWCECARDIFMTEYRFPMLGALRYIDPQLVWLALDAGIWLCVQGQGWVLSVQGREWRCSKVRRVFIESIMDL